MLLVRDDRVLQYAKLIADRFIEPSQNPAPKSGEASPEKYTLLFLFGKSGNRKIGTISATEKGTSQRETEYVQFSTSP